MLTKNTTTNGLRELGGTTIELFDGDLNAGFVCHDVPSSQSSLHPNTQTILLASDAKSFAMKSIGDQARDFRMWRGWGYSRMAEEVQKHFPNGAVNRQKITQLEEAGDRRPKYLVALARAMGTTVEVLEAGKWEPPTNTPVDLAQDLSDIPGDNGADHSENAIPSAHSLQNEISDVVIRQFETGGSMGRGIVLAEQPGVIKEWRVSDRWAQENVHRITSVKNLAIVTGFGPSMQPLFNPGDPLLVDRGINRADVDGIYFFRVGEEGFVKQLQRIPTGQGLILRAKSYNTLYDPFDITHGMDFEVFARVVKVWKGEEF